jgi:hypothetical protein
MASTFTSSNNSQQQATSSLISNNNSSSNIQNSTSSGSSSSNGSSSGGNNRNVGNNGGNKIDPEKRFIKQEKIGRGSFGEVFKGIDKQDNSVVAIKIIDLEEAEDEIEDIQQEIQVLSQCDSTFVTKYYGSFLKVGSSYSYSYFYASYSLLY